MVLNDFPENKEYMIFQIGNKIKTRQFKTLAKNLISKRIKYGYVQQQIAHTHLKLIVSDITFEFVIKSANYKLTLKSLLAYLVLEGRNEFSSTKTICILSISRCIT